MKQGVMDVWVNVHLSVTIREGGADVTREEVKDSAQLAVFSALERTNLNSFTHLPYDRLSVSVRHVEAVDSRIVKET